MKTGCAMVTRSISFYDNLFHNTKEIIRLLDFEGKSFYVYNLTEEVRYSCLPGDIVEYTKESCVYIIRNFSNEKRLERFNKKYEALQKQR